VATQNDNNKEDIKPPFIPGLLNIIKRAIISRPLDNRWYIDSGASDHVTDRQDIFDQSILRPTNVEFEQVDGQIF
jgi:hypothetical protein